MIKILFICHGNICRSPMAEFIFKYLADKQGVGDKLHVESRATSTEEIWGGQGNPIYYPAQKTLEKHGIPFDKKKRAQLITKADYEEYDYIVCMEDVNVRRGVAITGDKNGKYSKIMDYTERPGNVSDPWYTDNFDRAYDDIFEGCSGLIKSLL